MTANPTAQWKIGDAEELYEVASWGQGYFSISPLGNLLVHPTKDSDRFIDLKSLVDRLAEQGVHPPVLLRFSDLLCNRLHEISAAFDRAISIHNYPRRYWCVYPIKVNQQRHVVEEVLEFGRPLGFGLEAGSKPELLAIVALARSDTPIICNGFKDDRFIETAMVAAKIGRNIIPVVERYSELGMILRWAQEHDVRPQIGMRVKLAARGAGRWQASGGYKSKFGLTMAEIIQGLEELQARDMQDCLKLLHFHLGSQITNIRHLKSALIEAARVYCDLSHRGAGLEHLDVGGGLGVDYDGSQTNFHSSMNYSLEEYANDVVHYVQSVCKDARVTPPHLVSESGRAIAAHHSALVFSVLGVSRPYSQEPSPLDLQVAEDAPQPLRDLAVTHEHLTPRNVLEGFHDAQQALDIAINLFCMGHLSLKDRVIAEKLYWQVVQKVRAVAAKLDFVPEDLQSLDSLLADTYFCNFSLFQSMPDSWAIKQLFPVMPIHRLNEPPDRHAVLADVTCDSDGKIDHFIDRRDVKRTLRLHALGGCPYYLAALLVGAYQEILGDLHNLFGDTNAVHVSLDEKNQIVIDHVVEGDTVNEVLHYVQFNGRELFGQMQAAVHAAVEEGRLSLADGKRMLRFYDEGLQGYTYLQESKDETRFG